MIGIYKYQNKINGQCYIGQSINIEKRKYIHSYSSTHESSKEYNSEFHQALRKFGEENFSYEIIEEISPEEYSSELLDELEKYYIKYYNSYDNGYNSTKGGKNGFSTPQTEEKNGRALLKRTDVEYIRECYNNHIPFRTVYEEYKDKISKRGLQKVWWFETWQDIYPEYHTEENRYWHSHNAKANASEVASKNQRKFNKEQVLAMREDYDNGMTPKQVWLKHAPEVVWTTVYNIITRKSYTDI